MNIVYLIGNGFDKKLGMKTSYPEFYDYYCDPSKNPDKNSNEIISAFKKEIKNNIELWSDLENKLGDYLQNLDENSGIIVYEDLKTALRRYLFKAQSWFFNGFSTPYMVQTTKLKEDLHMPEKYLMNKEKEAIDSIFNNQPERSIKIITFNYTSTLEKLFKVNDRVLGDNIDDPPIEHINGDLRSKRLILGVNDQSQINNSLLRTSEKIRNRYIKQECYETYDDKIYLTCASWINKADIICIYGMSIGQTDNIWWQKILRNIVDKKSILIIFAYSDKISDFEGPEYMDYILEKKNDFVRRLNLDSSQIAYAKSRIFVSYSPQMFDSLIIPMGDEKN